MITVRTEVFLYIYNFTSVISGSRPIYDEHLPNGSGPLVSNRSLSLLLAFLSFCFSEIPGFCIGTRHRGDWRGRRYVFFVFLFLFVCFLFFCFFFSFNCTIWARLSVGTLGFSNSIPFCTGVILISTTRLWGLDCKLHCGNTSNLIRQNARTGFCLYSIKYS
jgi:hypothetical protein